LGGKDLERSFCFYHEGLGFKTSSKVEDGIIFFQTSGTRLALYPLTSPMLLKKLRLKETQQLCVKCPGGAP